mmetsp:Transcript_24123/g.60211  ORF Transcript_24123/g.60211 Transcript_24123/m.60211 type:complete len:121 (+) Transcript_24123:72-434(+)
MWRHGSVNVLLANKNSRLSGHKARLALYAPKPRLSGVQTKKRSCPADLEKMPRNDGEFVGPGVLHFLLLHARVMASGAQGRNHENMLQIALLIFCVAVLTKELGRKYLFTRAAEIKTTSQ